MQADGEVPPDKKHQQYLPVPGPGIDPEIGDFVGVIDVDAGQDACAPSINDVHEEQVWDGQPDRYLNSLPHRQPVVTAAGERGQTAKCVSHQASVEEDLAGGRMPE